MADMLIDDAKFAACLDAEADAIRAKTGDSNDIPFDYANNKGFADAIAAIETGGGGSLELLASGQYTLAENSTSGFSIPVSYTGTAKTVFVKADEITGGGWRTIGWIIETNLDLDDVVTDFYSAFNDLYTTVVQNGTTANTRKSYTGTYSSSLEADSINCGSGTAYSAKAGTYDWYIWGEAAS